MPLALFKLLVRLLWIAFLAYSAFSCSPLSHASNLNGQSLDKNTILINDVDASASISPSAEMHKDAETYLHDCVNTDVYQITRLAQSHRVHVHAKIQHIQPREKICLPAFGQRYAERFTLNGIFNAEKQNIKIEFDAFGCADNIAENTVVFDYTLMLQPIDDFHLWVAGSLSPVLKNNFAAYPGETLFIERNASACTQIDIVSQNKNDKVFTTIPDNGAYQDQEGVRFLVNRAFDLTRSFFAFGALKRIEVSGATDISIAIEPDMDAYASLILKDVLAIVGIYQVWMPARMPSHISIFAFENAFDLQHASGFARPNGVVLQWGHKAVLNTAERRWLIAHELFHLFNGEQLHFERADYQKMTWFVEGTTQYLALKAIRTLGLIHEKQYLVILSDIVNQMVDVYQLSVDERQNIQNKPYLDGFFLSWMIEQQWLQYQTGLSLEGFWAFLAQTTDWHEPKNVAWMKNQLESYSQFDFTPFFSLYVSGNARIPFEYILAKSGYCLRKYQIQKYDAGFRWAFDPAQAAYVILDVAPHSPAESLGIKRGDHFVMGKNSDWHAPDDKYLRRMMPDQRMQSFRVPMTPVMREMIEVVRCAEH